MFRWIHVPALMIALFLCSWVAVANAQGEKQPAPRTDLDAKSFAGSLQKQLNEKKRLTVQEKHILRILNSPDSAKRDRQVSHMERHVRVHLDLAQGAAIDWSTAIDWATVLEAVLQLLIKLLPLFL